MTREQLIAKAERDDASVLRAAATLKDNMDLQEKVANLRRELAEERAKPPPEAQVPRLVRTVTVTVPGPERVMERTVNVPTPCPKQAAEIKRLNAQLAKFKKYDIAEFEQWRRMVEAAKR